MCCELSRKDDRGGTHQHKAGRSKNAFTRCLDKDILSVCVGGGRIGNWKTDVLMCVDLSSHPKKHST